MANLFGLDIAGIVNNAISSAGGVRPGILTKTTPGTRTPGDLIGGTNPTMTTHSFQGFVEQKSERRAGQVGASLGGQTVSILGASVSPAAVPAVNDSVTIDSVTYNLVELVSRDPAEALYEFGAQAL